MIDLNTCDPRHLKIPYAVAAKFSRGDQEKFEELASVGNIGLVRAAARYEDGKGSTLASWLYAGVELRVRGYLSWCKRKGKIPTVSLDTVVGDDLTLSGALVGGEPDLSPEHQEVIDKALDLLTPTQRAAIVMHYQQGMTLREIGKILNLSYEWIRREILVAKATVARSGLATERGRHRRLHADVSFIQEWEKQNPEASERRWEKARAKMVATMKEKAAIRRATGHIYTHEYYCIDPVAKRLYGGFKSDKLAVAWLGVEPIGEKNQATIVRLCGAFETFTLRDFAATGIREGTVSQSLLDLARKGVVESVGRGKVAARGGQPPMAYRRTDRPAMMIMPGRRAIKYYQYDDGWRVEKPDA